MYLVLSWLALYNVSILNKKICWLEFFFLYKLFACFLYFNETYVVLYVKTSDSQNLILNIIFLQANFVKNYQLKSCKFKKKMRKNHQNNFYFKNFRTFLHQKNFFFLKRKVFFIWVFFVENSNDEFQNRKKRWKILLLVLNKIHAFFNFKLELGRHTLLLEELWWWKKNLFRCTVSSFACNSSNKQIN